MKFAFKANQLKSIVAAPMSQLMSEQQMNRSCGYESMDYMRKCVFLFCTWTKDKYPSQETRFFVKTKARLLLHSEITQRSSLWCLGKLDIWRAAVRTAPNIVDILMCTVADNRNKVECLLLVKEWRIYYEGVLLCLKLYLCTSLLHSEPECGLEHVQVDAFK